MSGKVAGGHQRAKSYKSNNSNLYNQQVVSFFPSGSGEWPRGSEEPRVLQPKGKGSEKGLKNRAGGRIGLIRAAVEPEEELQGLGTNCRLLTSTDSK